MHLFRNCLEITSKPNQSSLFELPLNSASRLCTTKTSGTVESSRAANTEATRDSSEPVPCNENPQAWLKTTGKPPLNLSTHSNHRTSTQKNPKEHPSPTESQPKLLRKPRKLRSENQPTNQSNPTPSLDGAHIPPRVVVGIPAPRHLDRSHPSSKRRPESCAAPGNFGGLRRVG